jgi:hypothetical protein
VFSAERHQLSGGNCRLGLHENTPAGLRSKTVGGQNTLLLGGTACLIGAAVFAAKLPVLRKLIRPIYVKKGIIPEIATGIQSAAELTMPGKKSV